jgi:hypothetical protein
MPNRWGLLAAHLWAVRSEVESQIRNMRNAQRHIDALPAVDDPEYMNDLRPIAEDLEQILDANTTIRALSQNALDETRRVTALASPSKTTDTSSE